MSILQKQIIRNTFAKNNLPINKTRESRLKGDFAGIYVYHPFGSTYYQNKRKIVKRDENSITYERYKIPYTMSYISTVNEEEFKEYLHMAISEAKRRRGTI